MQPPKVETLVWYASFGFSFVLSVVLFSVGQPCVLPGVTRKICSQLSPTAVSHRSFVPGRIRRPKGFRNPFANTYFMTGLVWTGSLYQGLVVTAAPLKRSIRMIFA